EEGQAHRRHGPDFDVASWRAALRRQDQDFVATAEELTRGEFEASDDPVHRRLPGLGDERDAHLDSRMRSGRRSPGEREAGYGLWLELVSEGEASLAPTWRTRELLHRRRSRRRDRRCSRSGPWAGC